MINILAKYELRDCSPKNRKSQRSPKKSPLKQNYTSQRPPSPPKSPTRSFVSQMKIITQLDEEELIGQNKDIELYRLKVSCETLTSQLINSDELQNTITVLHKRLEEAEKLRENAQKEQKASEITILSMRKTNNAHKEQIRAQDEQIQTLKEQVRSEDEQIKTQDQQIDQYKKKNQELVMENASLRQDMQSLIQQKSKVQRELEASTEYIIQMEEKVYKSNRISLELLKQLKQSEIECEGYQHYITDLKSRIAVYIPVQSDSVDKKLAKWINNYPERHKLKIMFMRESNGVYKFGSKRIGVKVERDNIKIRVGGGYLSIDEFIDQYTPVEIERLERNEPIMRFNERIAVQSTIVNNVARETSPVSRRSDSPNSVTQSPTHFQRQTLKYIKKSPSRRITFA